MNNLINEKFKVLAESDYKAFNEKLIPTNYKIFGIRMPALRKLAKEIATDNNIMDYLNNAEYTTYEHILLYGLVLGYLDEKSLCKQSLNKQSLNEQSLDEQSLNERSLNEQSLDEQSLNKQSLDEQSLNKQSLDEQSLNEQSLNKQSLNKRSLNEQSLDESFLREPLLETVFHYLDPLILKFDNWAHVDTIISSLKIFKKQPTKVLAHFLPLKTHPGEFTKRSFIVLLMTYFLEQNYIDSTLKHLTQIEQGQYYVDMAIAWTLCEGLVKQYQKTIPLLQQQAFSKFVHNKTIQKARESYRIPSKTKEYLKRYTSNE